MSHYPPPAQNWPGTQQHRPSPVPAMIVGAIIFAVGAGAGLVAGWILASAAPLAGLLDDFDDCPVLISATTPTSVALGEPFDLVLVLNDPDGAGAAVTSVDLSGDIVTDYQLVATDPPYSVTENYGQPDYLEISINKPLPSSGPATITLTLKPINPGQTTSDINVYFDNYYGSADTTVTLRTPEPPAPDPDF